MIRGPNKNNSEEGYRSILKYGLTARIGLPLITAFILVLGFTTPTDDRKMSVMSFGTIAFVLLCLFPELHSRRIEYDKHEIVIQSCWHKPRHIPWTEVLSFAPKPDGMAWILETRSGGKITLLAFLRGLGAFYTEATQHISQCAATTTPVIQQTSVDKIQKKRKKSSLLFLLVLLIPPLCFVLIKTEWVARLVALTTFYSIFSISCLLAALNPYATFTRSSLKFAARRAWQISSWLCRTIMLLGAFAVIYLATYLVVDCYGSLRFGHAYLSDFYGEVRQTSFNGGAYYFHQRLLVFSNNTIYTLSADFFPRVIKEHHIYHFLVAPRSNHVLECLSVDNAGGF